MAVPQRRISKTRKRMRRTHFKLSVSGLELQACGMLEFSGLCCQMNPYFQRGKFDARKTKSQKNGS